MTYVSGIYAVKDTIFQLSMLCVPGEYRSNISLLTSTVSIYTPVFIKVKLVEDNPAPA